MNNCDYIGLAALTDPEERCFYWDIYGAIQRGCDFVPLESIMPQRALELMRVVLSDHPELYWANFQARSGGCPPRLYFDFPNVIARNPETDFLLSNELNKFLEMMPASDSKYDLALAAYLAIAGRARYGESTADADDPAYQRAHSCIGCLIDRRAVCEGTAKATQLLLHRLGIPAYMVSGVARDSDSAADSHAWLLVYLEEAYYCMDPTWGGCAGGEDGPTLAYFLMCDSDIAGRYFPDDSTPMPPCDNIAGTYFAREKLLLSEWSLETLYRVSEARRIAKHSRIEIKFDNDSAYGEAKACFASGEDAARVLREAMHPKKRCSDFRFRYAFMDDMRVLSLMFFDGG